MSTVRKARAGENALGVISTRPGILLGGNTKNGVPVAFSGRVPVLVTNENGVVKQGDSLTVSATIEGYAMKATEDGYSIGRAISDAPDVATSSVLIVVENKMHTMSITSIAGLTTLASSPDSFIQATTTVYQIITNKLAYSTSVVTEYLSVKVQAVAGYFDKLFAKEIYTDKVCVKKSNGQDICITGDQVESMLNPIQTPLLTPPSVLGQTGSGSQGTTIGTTTTQATETATGTNQVLSTTVSTTTPSDTIGTASTTTSAETTLGSSTEVLPVQVSDVSASSSPSTSESNISTALPPVAIASSDDPTTP